MKRVLIIVVALLSIIILPNSVEAKNKVTINLFRSKECPHCEEALEYFNNHKEELGEYIELKTFEVENNKNNANLQTKVEEELNVPEKQRNRFPFFVIADEYQYGYSGVITFRELLNKAEKYIDDEEYHDIVENVRSKNNIKAKSLTLDELYKSINPTVTYIVFGIFAAIILGFVSMIIFSRK